MLIVVFYVFYNSHLYFFCGEYPFHQFAHLLLLSCANSEWPGPVIYSSYCLSWSVSIFMCSKLTPHLLSKTKCKEGFYCQGKVKTVKSPLNHRDQQLYISSEARQCPYQVNGIHFINYEIYNSHDHIVFNKLLLKQAGTHSCWSCARHWLHCCLSNQGLLRSLNSRVLWWEVQSKGSSGELEPTPHLLRYFLHF